MTSIGERLRRQRLQNRISLETVSVQTKIGVRLLEAIEAEQFEKLPGGVFRRSFVLQYARALGLDPEEIAAELKQLNDFDEVPAMPLPETIAAREPRTTSGFTFRGDLSGIGGSMLGSLVAAVGVILGCSLIYSWWQTPGQTRSSKLEIASVQPKPQVQVTPPPPLAAPSQTKLTQTTAALPTTPAPAPAAPPSTPAADGAAVRVGLSADEKTWISISSDGKNVFANALEPHQTKVFEASEKIRLLVGNAGGLEISLNGKPIGPIGPRGQIRVVELTPAGFQIVPRKSPTLEPLAPL